MPVKFYSEDKIPLPKEGEIIVFRRQFDGLLYYKTSKGLVSKVLYHSQGIYSIESIEEFLSVVKIRDYTGGNIKILRQWDQEIVFLYENDNSGPVASSAIYGSRGAPGPQGFQGTAGITGSQGFQGATGSGSQGAQGFQGSQGAQGTQGSQGAQGPQSTTGFTLMANSDFFNPLDATTYYYGAYYTLPPTTVANGRGIYVPKSGVIKAIYGSFANTGVLGTGENSTIYLRLNGTTDTVISTTVVNNATITTFNNNALGITVAQGDFLEIKWITPTWVINPLTVLSTSVIYIE